MRKRFKKRLLGIILTILMVVSVIPVQQVQPVKAAAGDTIPAGTTIYLRPNAATTWISDGAVMAFKTSANDKQSGIVIMKKMDDGLTWSGETTAEATNIDFLRLDPNDKHVWNEAGTWPGLQSGKYLYTFASTTEVTPTGMWTTYSSTGSETTSYFNVNATLVDYFNNGRVEKPENKFYNEGNLTGPTNAPYSQLNQWISNLQGYALNGVDSKDNVNAPVPLYFGDLLHAKQAGGNLTWYWQGANVAFGPDEKTANKYVAQGIVGKNLDKNGNLITSYNNNGEQVKVPFFNEKAYDGQSKYMRFYNNLQFPFTKTTNDKGVSTYSFDSEQNTVHYDYENNKIVRDDTIKIHDVGGDTGYFPFNSVDPSAKDNLNYGFGTQFTIPFTVTENGRNVDGTSMTFKFTGDDDVWVYIDGALVLDMGGAHYKAEGEINFATQMATITTGTSDAKLGNQPTAGGRIASQDNEKSTVNFSNIKVKKSDDTIVSLADYMKTSGTVHELKMYYMERGMWDSNMSISYSFVPLPSGLTLSKTLDTKDVNAGLKNAVQGLDKFDFNIQTRNLKAREANYSDVRNLGYTLYDYDDNTFPGQVAKNSTATFSSSYYASEFINTTDKDKSSAFYAGTGFKITESIPQGTKLQYDESKTTWGVYDSITSREEIQRGNGAVATFDMGDASSSEMDVVNRYVNFVNTPKVGSLSVEKKYEGDAPKDKTFGFTVKVDLTGGEYYDPYELAYNGSQTGTTDKKGHFTLKAGEKVTFAGIPAGATYQITEDAPTEKDTWELDTTQCTDLTGTIGANTTSAAVVTNKTKTTPKNYVIYAEAGKTVTYAPDGVTIKELTKTTTDDTDITTNVNGGKGEFTPTSPNKKYDVAYKGTTTDKGNFEGTITVLTYQATDKVYVFDYGLESNIAEKNANGDGLFQGGTFYNKEATGDMATTAKLGEITPAQENSQTTISGSNIEIDKDGKAASAVTFKPIAFMDKAENYTYTADITKKNEILKPNNPETGTTVTGTIKTMPANVVYYEDDFNATSDNKDGTAKIVYSGTKEQEGPSLTLKQSNGQTEQYGHDDAYTTGTGDSNGTSRKMTDGAQATFTFTGTGFDVIARTTSKTAGITYIVSKKVGDDSWKAVSVGTVDTYYANGDLYQIPVIHKDFEEKATYRVKLRATKSDVASVIYLDGIRIYNPLGKEGNENYIDNEEGATFVKVSDLVLGNGKVTETGIDGAITNQVIDGSKAAILGYAEGEEEGKALSALGYTIVEDNTNGSVSSTNSNSILQYLQAGPNNEVYLDDSAAVAFVAKADRNEANRTIQVEAKLANLGQCNGEEPVQSKEMALRVLGADGIANAVAQVKSSTAMYYSIDLTKCIDLGNDQYLVVIVGNSDYEPGGTHCISFTNIKYKGYEFSSPYENDAAKKYIDMSAFATNSTKFVSIDFPSVHKNVWSNYKCSVTLNENVFEDATPKFKLYYKNINGDLKPISVTAKKIPEEQNKYLLRFRAPNALGNFAVELHYVVNGEESTDYIATTMTVTR